MAIGDHLAVRFGIYWHHGIDVGNHRVVHFGRGLHDLENACVEVVTRQVFSDGRPIVTIESDACFSSEIIMERAMSAVGRRNYDLWHNNCEHFVNWCRSGRATSSQSQHWRAGIRNSVSAVVRRVAVRRVFGKFSSTSLAAEGVQMTVETLACHRGIQASLGRAMGLVAGSATAAAVGWLRGGPVGATVQSGIYVGSQAVAGRMTSRFCRQLPQLLRRCAGAAPAR